MKTEKQWRDLLTEEQFLVCRKGGTEEPFSGKYHNAYEPGVYHCVCCDAALFNAEDKYDSGTGWPSFTRPAEASCLTRLPDHSLGVTRTEVRCAACDAHLGHVFADGPNGGERYCINSVSLQHKGAGFGIRVRHV